MEKEFTAKTVDEAKALAARDFGVSADDIDFEILEQPKKTIFGGLKGEARVKAIYEAPAEPEKTISFESNESNELEDEEEKEYAAPVSESASQAVASLNTAENAETEESEGELPEDFDIENSAKVNAAVKYLTDVLHALKLNNFTITPTMRDGNVVLDITGEKLGAVIGKRGETLDSLQYLTILASNRAEESYCRLSLDCNGYRDKRRETLENLARRTSAKVIKQGRKIALEPMNPYERRIIHSCVADIEGVSSHSVGTEPYRKVVIYADRPAPQDKRRRGGKNEQRQSGGTPVRSYRQSSGFSTSFEREYKRRTYEPDESSGAGAGEFSKETVDAEKNAALYGKIEL